MWSIRPASPADLPTLRTVCALAYLENPLMRWVLPDDATRADACAAWLGPSLERYVAAGRVDVVTVADEPVAVAAWRVPGVDAVTAVTASLPSPAGVLRALVGGSRAQQVLTALGGAAAFAPAPAGPYLNYLAVRPGHQGQGLGGDLLEHGLAALRGVGGTPWLGTTDPRNLPFYERHGFNAAGTHPLDEGGPGLVVLHGVRRVPVSGPAA